jgi:hypothetical protein
VYPVKVNILEKHAPSIFMVEECARQETNKSRRQADQTCFRTRFALLALLSYPEDGGNMLFRNIVWRLLDCKALDPRRQNFVVISVRTSNPTY